MRRSLFTILLFIAGLLIFGVVFYMIGLKRIFLQLLKINLWFYLLAIISAIITLLLWTLRWKSFIKSTNYDVPLLSLFKILIIGLAINNLTPVAKLGGEPVRAYLLKKEFKIPMRRGFAIILSDLTTEFLISAMMVVISMLLITFYIQPPAWLSVSLVIFTILTIIGFGSLLGIYSNKNFINKTILWSIKKIKRLRPLERKILTRYKEFQESFKRCFKDKKLFSKAIIYGTMMKVFDVLKFLFIFMSLNYHIGVLEILIIIGISIILSTIPATPGGLGIIEGGIISSFILIGVSADVSAVAIFLERLISFWGITIIGGVLGIRTHQ